VKKPSGQGGESKTARWYGEKGNPAMKEFFTRSAR
jgi:hypothetical protein